MSMLTQSVGVKTARSSMSKCSNHIRIIMSAFVKDFNLGFCKRTGDRLSQTNVLKKEDYLVDLQASNIHQSDHVRSEQEMNGLK